MAATSRVPGVLGNTSLSDFDTIAIGSGAGGALVADVLTRHSEIVLILEAGTNRLSDPGVNFTHRKWPKWFALLERLLVSLRYWTPLRAARISWALCAWAKIPPYLRVHLRDGFMILEILIAQAVSCYQLPAASIQRLQFKCWRIGAQEIWCSRAPPERGFDFV